MGQTVSSTKCKGCSKTSPFFGEIYGRMDKNAHGSLFSGMGHSRYDRKPEDTVIENTDTEYDTFNRFKNYSLIPFYGTVQAILVIVAAIFKDTEKLDRLGVCFNFITELKDSPELKFWFLFRLCVSIIPIAGTLINGAMDIISQIGLEYKNRNHSPVQRDVEVFRNADGTPISFDIDN